MFVGELVQIRGIQKSSFHPIQFGSLCWSGPWESSRKKLLNPSRSIETNRYTSFLLAVYWKPSFPTRTRSGLVQRFSPFVCKLRRTASINHRHRSSSNSHRVAVSHATTGKKPVVCSWNIMQSKGSTKSP